MPDPQSVIAAPHGPDLTVCDREPIHIPGSVQPFGVLLALSRDWTVVQASDNAGRFLGGTAAAMLGQPLGAVLGAEAIHVIRGRVQILHGAFAVERIFNLPLIEGGPAFDVALHLSGQTIVLEAEPSAPENLNAIDLVRSMIARLQQAGDFNAFGREAVRQMRALTGFDRAMLYRFRADGTGEVVAESVRSDLEPYLGLRYPASDIPQQARALYERNWLRVIADVEGANAALVPPLSPGGEPLDLSMSVLRSVSPVHIEYLRNMGVGASLSVSILRAGKLWGLLACHHMEARHISLERRTAAELFGQMISWILESREREVEIVYEAKSRDIHNRMMSTMAAGGAELETLAGIPDELAGIIDCDGAGVWIDGEATLRGSSPTHEEFAGLVRFLNRAAASRIYATDEIQKVYEPGAAFADRAAGLLAIPISRAPRDYLVFFRREVVRAVIWGGDPGKPATSATPSGERVSPRKSFEAWREIVRGQATPWTAAEQRVAEALRSSLLEVILHFADAVAKDRKTAQERQELLIAELNHRVRNILSLINSLIAQSQADAISVEEFVEVVSGRIQAFARAHDQLTRATWGPGSLRDLIMLEASAYLGRKADRVRVAGPEVLLEPQAFSTMALVVHELMTNSAKYGALADMRGEVSVAWEFDPSQALVVSWKETGGPLVKPPTRRGFGTTIIDRSIPYELKGEATIQYKPAGVEGRFVLPGEFVSPGPAQIPLPIHAATPPRIAGTPLSGAALLVEDNMIIALEAEEILRRLGAERVDLAASARDALRLIEKTPPDFALLDLNLGSDETSLAVAKRLTALGIPFLFATGYGDTLHFPPDLATVPVAHKPYTVDSVEAALAAIIAARA